MGIFGITSFIFVIIGTIRSIIKVYKNTEDNTYKVFFMGMMASVIAFLVMNLLDNLFFSPQTTTYFWIFIAISENIVFRHNKKKIEV